MKATNSTSSSLDRWVSQLRKGGLSLAVLAILCSGKRYGLEILRCLERDAGLIVPEGTIYPLLARLKVEGFVTTTWVESDSGHPRKYYQITSSGRQKTTEMIGVWGSFKKGIDALIPPLRKETSHGRK